MKKAFITGITGQDGHYLATFLLEKGYQVHGLQRRSSSDNTVRLTSILNDEKKSKNFYLHYGDLSDSSNLIRLVKEIAPDEIYNLGAMSHVQVSYETPEYTADVNAIGCLRLLEAIRILGFEKKTRFYQASTSELFGSPDSDILKDPDYKGQNEDTPLYPRSPYGAAKQFAHAITINYREAYNLYAVNGICFNHESPMRGEEFVTRKIVIAAVRIAAGLKDTLYLGNLDAKRDWGYTGDYVDAMWRMLQQDTPQDFVIATGQTHSVREFSEKAFSAAGIDISWTGESGTPYETGVCRKTGRTIIKIDPQLFRPAEIDILKGDPSKAKEILGWQPKTDFDTLVKMMVIAEQEAIHEIYGSKIKASG